MMSNDVSFGIFGSAVWNSSSDYLDTILHRGAVRRGRVSKSRIPRDLDLVYDLAGRVYISHRPSVVLEHRHRVGTISTYLTHFYRAVLETNCIALRCPSQTHENFGHCSHGNHFTARHVNSPHPQGALLRCCSRAAPYRIYLHGKSSRTAAGQNSTAGVLNLTAIA